MKTTGDRPRLKRMGNRKPWSVPDGSMDQAAMLLSLFTQGIEIAPIILFGIETSRAVITPLDDVPGNAGIARRVRRGIRTSLSLNAASEEYQSGWVA